ncbi:MAG: hypothetical protein AAF502_18025 [Bacteroidota bacterium]
MISFKAKIIEVECNRSDGRIRFLLEKKDFNRITAFADEATTIAGCILSFQMNLNAEYTIEESNGESLLNSVRLNIENLLF